MDYKSIKVSDCYESETNPRGSDFEDASFKDLVASIKEQGVLVPILVRPRPKGKQAFEVIAGNRRFRAAKQLEIPHIHAMVQWMDDSQAREAQIVENLQRQDIHPLEEGQAYRDLIEGSKLTVKDVAIKVGKSETYVRDRLFLTNLSALVRKSYRSGKIVDTVAVLIAKLSETDQPKALEFAEESEWEKAPSAGDVKEWIRRQFNTSLDRQPWLKDKAAIAALPAHLKNCHSNDAALFGDLKQGQCTDLACWQKRMEAWIKLRQEKAQGMVVVSDSYGKPSERDVLSRSAFVVIEKKKDRCKFAIPAIVGEGVERELGKELVVCVSPECKKHFTEKSEYQRTPKEEANRKAARKKEIEKQRAKEEQMNLAIIDALAKVKWPLSEKHLDALLDLVFERCSTSYQMPIVKRHGLKADTKKEQWGDSRDYEKPLRRLVNGDNELKLHMIFELLLPSYSIHSDGKEELKLISKL